MASLPLIIAHRGASGDRPEHAPSAYRLAIEQGADVIEPDVVIAADGTLLLRHDLGLRRSTDIASRAEFARHATTVDGSADWLVADLDWPQLASLRCRQPWPDRSAARDGLEAPWRLQDLLQLAAEEARRRERPIIVYPECKHPAWHRARGLDFLTLLTDCLQQQGWLRADAPLWLQCFEWDLLDQLKARTGLRCFALIGERDACEPAALRGRFDGVGIAKAQIDPRRPDGRRRLDALLAAGLAVHAWTFRADQPGSGWPDADAELVAYLGLPLEALFCDHPRRARELRGRLLCGGGGCPA